jgi:succinate dehydrogenase / fumarate reductase flavoprotein subunit
MKYWTWLPSKAKPRGIIVRNMDTGTLERHGGHAVVLATGGFGKIFYLSTLAMGCNASAIWRAHKRGAYFPNPSWTQIHPTSLPQSGEYQSKLTGMIFRNRKETITWNVVIRLTATCQDISKRLWT